MLKEEKRSVMISTPNLTSEMETIEELLRNYTLHETIINTESYYSDVNLLKTFESIGKTLECYNYELKVINNQKIIKKLFDYFNEQFPVIEENSFNSACNKFLSLLNINHNLENEEFFIILTKRLNNHFLLKNIANTNKIDMDVKKEFIKENDFGIEIKL